MLTPWIEYAWCFDPSSTSWRMFGTVLVFVLAASYWLEHLQNLAFGVEETTIWGLRALLGNKCVECEDPSRKGMR